MKRLRLGAILSLAGLGLLVACGSDGHGTGPNGMTVSGTVQDLIGEPIGGAAVLVPGGSPVTTGPDGRFSIQDVVAPYDLALILANHNTAVVWKGLTRPDPTLLSPYSDGAWQSATISGTTPTTSGKVTLVLFDGGDIGGVSRADPTTGQYFMTVSWQGSATTFSGHLYLLRTISGPIGSPVSYDGFASRPLTISSGGDLPGNNFDETELADPPEQSIGGVVAVPAGYTLNDRRPCLTFRLIPFCFDVEQGLLPSAFTYPLPDLGGVSVGLAAWAQAGIAQSFAFAGGIPRNSADISIALDAAAHPVAPANGAAGVGAGTPFGWTQGGGTGVNIVQIIPEVSTDPAFAVFTMAADASVPDLGNVGMGMAAGVRYYWNVHRLVPVASADEAAGPGFLSFINLEAGDASETYSEFFTFTTPAAAGAVSPGPATDGAARAAAAFRGSRWIREPVTILGGPRQDPAH